MLPAVYPASCVFSSALPAPPAPHPLLAGILMDVNTSWQHSFTLLCCCQCRKPGHFARYCPQGLEVRYLLSVEQEELLMQLLAAKDATGTPLLDMAMLESLSTEEVNAAVPLPEAEEDF